MTVVQSLTKTIGLPAERVAVLDTFRRKRNLSDYTGEDIDHASVNHCAAEANALLNDLRAWLKANRPDLLPRSGAASLACKRSIGLVSGH